jgi:hypothetical protein
MTIGRRLKIEDGFIEDNALGDEVTALTIIPIKGLIR